MASSSPSLFALFQKRFDGDDALLELARLRFREADLGMELYASSPGELEGLLQFRPGPETPVVAHLPREINLLDPAGRVLVLLFATTFGDRIKRFVVHDQLEMSSQSEPYYAALAEINSALEGLAGEPRLFIEYAAGLAPGAYCAFHEKIKNLRHISACIDIGHLGIYFVREIYRQENPDQDICAFHPEDPHLPQRMEGIRNAVEQAISRVLPVVRQLGELDKPLHFHLHDGHPLSTSSKFGVSDHLSFCSKIPIPFLSRGETELPTMFGVRGLKQIVGQALATANGRHLTFSLEIHPTEDSLPLEEAASLFRHWQIKTNAEKMNHWLAVIVRNHRKLLAITNQYE